MTDQNNAEYFRARERAERAAALAATSEAVKQVHEELARGYAALARDVVPAAGDSDHIAAS